MCVCVCQCVCLGHSLISKVGESFKLILVYLLDDVVVHRRQDGFLTREVLVKVVHVPFGFLKEQERRMSRDGVSTRIRQRHERPANAYNAWFERRPDLPLLQQRPVDLSEERVELDGLLQPLSHHAAQTLVRTLSHELRSDRKHRERDERGDE